MARDRQRGQSATAGVAGIRETGQDAKSLLERIAKVVGNDAIAKRIQTGTATRDQMIAFVTERLSAVKEFQSRELALTKRGANFEWWRSVADSHKEDATKPQPKRWQATAQAYDEAVDAMCRGDLRRGQALLESAHAMEQETAENTTSLVDKPDVDAAAAIDPAAFVAMVAETPACGEAAVPEPVRRLVREILNVEQTVEDMPGRRRRRDPWWTLDEEEEEEEDGG